MLTALSGSLLSHHYAERLLAVEFSGQLGETTAPDARRQLRSWWSSRGSQLGPASSLRSIWDAAAVPLAEHLGFDVGVPIRVTGDTQAALLTSAGVRVGLVAATWNVPLDRLWREAVRDTIDMQAGWSLCTNGRAVRLVDAQRTYSRAHIQFELPQAIESIDAFGILWGLMRADAFRAQRDARSAICRIIEASTRHGHAVGRSLRVGVIASLQHLLDGLSRSGQRELPALFDEALTVVYRTLFLMFAEARGLVPNWHPLYREAYTIEVLRDRLERQEPVHGLWETLQAIARLAYRGCRAGTLVVPAFNGRLFSPALAPLVESCAIEDDLARKALLRLSGTTVRSRRVRIDYRDLGVEQLGAVYESVLDYTPDVAASHGGHAPVVLRRGGEGRKATGSFYTPQSLTDYLVRRTLHPLVADVPAERILQLRVVDPAMGSAAFLVSACRYLAGAYERALVREGSCHEADLDEGDRSGFRRHIAQRCLFGVDLNPTAVQVARLSMWLATLSSGKPLSFLDHRLVCGDSLIGASPVDIARQPPGETRRGRGRAETPLFSEGDFEPSLARAVDERRWLAETADDSADIVRHKERRLDALRRASPWKSVADLWCSCWMWPERATAPDAAVFASLCDVIVSGTGTLPASAAGALLARSRDIARDCRFFHWVLEFPEIYFDAHGRPLANPGFDAVLGNPPWDVIGAASREKAFLRHSGIYRHLGKGHINRYQVFVERALTLARRGGRVGLVLPSGFATDHTAASLRRRLLNAARVDTISGFDNRKAIFPIHRSVRFLTCTSTLGDATVDIACRFGIDDPGVLEGFPDSGDVPDRSCHPISLTPALIEALSGDTLAIPELRSEADLRILDAIVHRIPRLSDAVGWNVRFGRELNATEDRRHFHRGRDGCPVLEGKHIEPFRVHLHRAGVRIAERAASRLLDAAQTFLRPRLAYRDVSSTTNRLSLIAAIVPAGAVTTHSLFCLKTPLARDNQAFLCAMLNSYVANYLVRQVMTTHLGSTTVERLRVPKLPRTDNVFAEIVSLTHMLEGHPTPLEHARVQALAAYCYGLTAGDFQHVLATFPLVEASARTAAMEQFLRITR